MIAIACLLLVTLVMWQPAGAANWAYRGPNGPFNWRNIEPQCGGYAQSPINIKGGIIAKSPKPRWLNYERTPARMIVANNGHSIVLTAEYNGTPKPQVQIGADTFQLDNVHFHWGSDDSDGTEHAFLHKKYQLEMHAVHKRIVNGVIQAEISVFGILYALTPEPNSGLARFISNAAAVSIAETEVEIPPFPWSAIIPQFTTAFYTYKGSLTTPPCSEVVTWYVRKQLARVSRAQLQLFRLLRNEENEEMASNFRPTQPLWGRPVYYVI